MLRTLEIWGDPQERGRRHGQTLGADIRLLRRAILTYLARISLYAGALPLYGLLQLAGPGVLALYPAPPAAGDGRPRRRGRSQPGEHPAPECGG